MRRRCSRGTIRRTEAPESYDVFAELKTAALVRNLNTGLTSVTIACRDHKLRSVLTSIVSRTTLSMSALLNQLH